MEHHRLRDTPLEVSTFCLGTGGFGTRVRDADTDRLVAAYLEAGGNFFDTAHCYAFWEPGGLGASERELGACLHRLGCRGGVVVATKGAHPDGGPDYPRPDRYLSAQVIASDLDESLDRLGLEWVDLYYLHRDDPRVPVEEVLGILNGEVARGRIRYLGASNWSVSRLAAAQEAAARLGLRPFVISQVQWSLAVPTWQPSSDPTTRFAAEEEARWHEENGLPIAAYTSTAQGYFAGRADPLFDTPANQARRERAREVAARHGCTPSQVALAYLLHQPLQVIPILGTTDPRHLAEDLGATSVSLTPEEVHYLRDG